MEHQEQQQDQRQDEHQSKRRKRTAVGEAAHRDELPHESPDFAGEHENTDVSGGRRPKPAESESPRGRGGMDF